MEGIGCSLTFAAAIDEEGNEVRSLLLLLPMNIESQIKTLEQKVEALVSDKPGFFLVEVRISATNNIKVFIDADNGISIDGLVQCNRSLYKQIEESGLFPGGDFSLEVSSPGLDEPIKLHRQYVKNIGRNVEVIGKDGRKTEGKLLSITETEIIVEEEKARLTGKVGQGKGKKKEWIRHNIPFENIKSTKIQIRF